MTPDLPAGLSLADVKATFDAMTIAGVPPTDRDMCVRRINRWAAVAVYHGHVYLLTDNSGELDYSDLDRESVRATALVGPAWSLRKLGRSSP